VTAHNANFTFPSSRFSFFFNSYRKRIFFFWYFFHFPFDFSTFLVPSRAYSNVIVVWYSMHMGYETRQMNANVVNIKNDDIFFPLLSLQLPTILRYGWREKNSQKYKKNCTMVNYHRWNCKHCIQSYISSSQYFSGEKFSLYFLYYNVHIHRHQLQVATNYISSCIHSLHSIIIVSY
jgi:hypothetical protein